jgi:hypothetical protein
MSAYKRIQCKIVNKECLLQALDTLGLTHTVHDKPVALTGYEGRLRTGSKAEIVVSKSVLNKSFTGASNDLGFTWNEKSNSYDMICSDYDAAQKLPQRILQAYAMSVIKKAAEAGHFTVKEASSATQLQSRKQQKVKMVFSKVI